MIKIITGSTGSNHITSDDDRQFNNAIYGDSYVLPLGEKFKATLVDNNTITISDGDLVLQGCHARINAGTTEDVTIETGAIGVNRIDLIVARYELDSVTGYEDVNLVVIKGEESVNPVAPAYNTGSLRNGANVVDMPLYKVSITGISIEEVQQLFTVSEFIAKSVERLNSNLTNLIVGSIPIGDTSITLTSAKITTDSIIDIYFKDKVLAPTVVTVTNGQIVIEIDEQETITEVGVRCL